MDAPAARILIDVSENKQYKYDEMKVDNNFYFMRY